MFTTTHLQRLLIGLAIITAGGVLVHDSKLDQAATVALAIPLGLTLSLPHIAELKGDSHTHVERAAFEKTSQMSSGVPPRTDNRKYLLTKHLKGFNIPEQHTLVIEPSLL